MAAGPKLSAGGLAGSPIGRTSQDLAGTGVVGALRKVRILGSGSSAVWRQLAGLQLHETTHRTEQNRRCLSGAVRP